MSSLEFKDLSEEDKMAKVTEFLIEKSNENELKETFIKTIEISHKFYGEKSNRKIINPLLYKMEKLDLIKKSCNENGGDPKWSIKTKKLDD
jgi:hypothetical protein